MNPSTRRTRFTHRVPVAILLVVQLVVYLGGITTAGAEEPTPDPSPSVSSEPASPSSEPSTSEPSPVESPASEPAATETILVRLRDGLTEAEQADAISRGGGVEVSSIPALRLHVVAVPQGTVAEHLDAYRADPDVESAERDRIRDITGTPSDPAYGDQWSLPLIGWDQLFGSVDPAGSATIAVLDTGVQTGDVTTVEGWSAFGTDPLADPHGHGTWLASIAAATADNGEGIAGVAYDGASVMPVQVLDANAVGQDSDIIAGVVWAVDHGADVILMGFSNPGRSDALQAAVDYAWDHGAVLVAATGNDGSSTATFPAGLAKVVGVSATDQSDALWSGSNYGAATFIAAPGVDVAANAVGGGTVSVTGTSAAAAIVAGAAALLAAEDPSATNDVIVGRLARNADPAGTAEETGNGRVNLARAVADDSTEGVTPAGAPGGGPLVGPYVAAAPQINMDMAPTFTTAGTRTFTVLVESTSGGGNATGCITVELPTGYTLTGGAVTGTTLTTGKTWNTPVVDTANRRITWTAASAAHFLGAGEFGRLVFDATTPSTSTANWTITAWDNTGCTGGSGSRDQKLQAVRVGPLADPQYSAAFRDPTTGDPVANLTVTSGAPGAYRIRITRETGSTNVRSAFIALPVCFTSISTPTMVTGAGKSSNWTAALTDNGIRLDRSGAPSNDLTLNGEFVEVQFTATASCAPGAYTWLTAAASVASKGGSNTVTTVINAQAQPTMTVAPATRSTSTVVSCADSTRAVNRSTTCTATVTDTAAGTPSSPTGSVTFTSTGTGAFTSPGATCTLSPATSSTSTCSVTYTPTAVGTGTHNIKASYTATGVFTNSSDATGFNITVNERTTSTSVDCQEPRAINQGSTCTVVVSDTDAGTKSDPTGSVSFTRSGAGNGTFSAASCTLTSDGDPDTFTSSCQVTYTPTAGAGTHKVTGTYDESSSALHASSDGFDEIDVNERTTSTSVSCTPSGVALNGTTTCEATVTDTDSGTKSNPAGTVTLTSSVSGTFAPSATCTLAPVPMTSDKSSCTVSYTVTNTATNTLTGTYNEASSAVHQGSAGSFTLTVSSVTVSPNTQQYSDRVTFSATLTPVTTGSSPTATTVTFKVGSQVVGTVPLSESGGVLVGTLSDVPLLEPTPYGTAPTGQMAPGVRTVTAEFGNLATGATVANPTTTLTITKEDARAWYTGDTFVSTGSSTASTATVVLSATIKDITAVDPSQSPPNPDNFAGDIRNAKVKFVNRDAGNAVLCTASVGLVSMADTTVGTATCNWTASIGANDSVQFTIGVVVGDIPLSLSYYSRDHGDDNTTVTVSKSLNNFITGGGYLNLVNSSGICAGAVGSKNNFGFNVKYNKSLTNLQGNMNIIIRSSQSCTPGHSGPRVYQIKTNSMDNLTVNSSTGVATFTSKANIRDITDPYNPIPLDAVGNGTLRVTMDDNGEPGKNDTIGITMWNKAGGMWFSSRWDGTRTVEQLLGGGNLQVR